MSEARRTVRATASFFEDVDRQFPPERGPNGEPSANGFEVLELLRIVERLATGFDELPELIPGADGTATGMLRNWPMTCEVARSEGLEPPTF